MCSALLLALLCLGVSVESVLDSLASSIVEKVGKLKGSDCSVVLDEAKKIVEEFCKRYGLFYTELFERLLRGFVEGFIVCPQEANDICLVLRIKEKRVDNICIVEDVEARLAVREI